MPAMPSAKPEWGDKYEQAIAIFNRPLDTLAAYKAVAARIKFPNRLGNLPWSHHQAVAYLPDDKRAAVGARVRAIYDDQAKERKEKTQGRPKSGEQKPVETLPPVKSKSRDAAGAAVNVSGKLIDAASSAQSTASSSRRARCALIHATTQRRGSSKTSAAAGT
ncbi:MAG: hypothetical protein WD872_16765 [Pirellulaceae bacterium]